MAWLRPAIRPVRLLTRGQGFRAKLHPVTGIQMNKFHGQHILKEMSVVDKIVSAAQIEPAQTVMEIGPGTGNLTMKLLPLARHVVALEIDARLAVEVERRAAAKGYDQNHLTVIQSDCLHQEWPKFDVLVANLPYNITTPFLFKLLMHKHRWKSAVVMIQEEVAFKLLADPGEDEFSRLSLNVRLFARILRVCEVKSGCFFPQPRVCSQVIKVVPREDAPNIDFEEWDGLIRIGYRHKLRTMRKVFSGMSVVNMLEHNYKTWCSINQVAPDKTPFKKLLLDTISEAGLAWHLPKNLDIPKWMDLLERFHKKGIYFVNVAHAKDDAAGGRKSKKLWEKSSNYWDDDSFEDKFMESDGTVTSSGGGRKTQRRGAWEDDDNSFGIYESASQ